MKVSIIKIIKKCITTTFNKKRIRKYELVSTQTLMEIANIINIFLNSSRLLHRGL